MVKGKWREKNTNHPFETRRKSENVYTVEKSPAIMRDIAFGFIVRRSCFSFLEITSTWTVKRAAMYTLYFHFFLCRFSSRSLLFPNQVSEYKFNKLRANGDGRRRGRWIHLENKLRNAFFMKWMRERAGNTYC